MSAYSTTEHNRRERLRRRIADAYSTVRHFRLSHEDLLQRLADIHASADWQRAPGVTIAYLDGFGRALYDAITLEVHFYYVTERGPVAIRPGSRSLPGSPLILTDEECSAVDRKNYPRGHAWPATETQPIAWWSGPRIEAVATKDGAP